jgi:hypothetical protein
MAYTTGYTEIGKLVDKYLLVRELQQDRYFTFLQMACNCYREISLRHSNANTTSKVTVSALGIIEMPTDMVGFGNLFVPINGEWWSFTKKGRKVMTTTTTGMVEGQDSDMGEGVDVHDDLYYGYGGKGGVNAYYMNIDWKARRIFCDGFKSDTAVLQYTSSGLVIGAGSTYVPLQCEPVINAYIDWQKEINAVRSIALLQTLEKYYTDSLFQLRLFNFLPSKDEIADAWDANSTQTPQR